MSSNIVLNSAEFTGEQKEYLRSFFAGIAQRGLTPFVGHTAEGLITSDPASGLPNQAIESEPLWFNAPVSDLSREERWKFEQDPFTIWEKLLHYSNQNQPPTEDDRFRIKYFGLFYVAPAQDSFMLRLRVPGGILTTQQLRGLAQMAHDWGSGHADLTTRSNLQIREFQPKDIVRVLNRVQSLGMTSRGSGADNIRNITASPTTGLDPQELLDVAPLAEALQAYISNSPDMYELPRKFNVAFDNGGAISVVADTNDIGFVAVEVGEGHSVPAGIYFRVLLSGITGHRQFATDCGILLRPDQTVAVAVAMIRIFTKHSDRTNRKKARLKYLIDSWGVEKFLSETERLLAFRSSAFLPQSANLAVPPTVQGTSVSIRNLNPPSTTSASPSLSVACQSRRCAPSPTLPTASAPARCALPSGKIFSSPTSPLTTSRQHNRLSRAPASITKRALSSAAP
jgi:ferredoxin-nitrite reductase